jgi:hypothetical protein
MMIATRTRLGPYEITEAIGAVGMRQVYRARGDAGHSQSSVCSV